MHDVPPLIEPTRSILPNQDLSWPPCQMIQFVKNPNQLSIYLKRDFPFCPTRKAFWFKVKTYNSSLPSWKAFDKHEQRWRCVFLTVETKCFNDWALTWVCWRTLNGFRFGTALTDLAMVWDCGINDAFRCHIS